MHNECSLYLTGSEFLDTQTQTLTAAAVGRRSVLGSVYKTRAEGALINKTLTQQFRFLITQPFIFTFCQQQQSRRKKTYVKVRIHSAIMGTTDGTKLQNC